MLDKKDLKQITEIVNSSISSAFGDFWDKVLEPYLKAQFKDNDEDHEEIFRRLDKNDREHDRIFEKLDQNDKDHKKIFRNLNKLDKNNTKHLEKLDEIEKHFQNQEKRLKSV